MYLLLTCLLFHSFYISKTKSPSMGTLLNGALIARSLNNPLTSYFLKNLDFLLSHSADFDKSTSFYSFVFATLEFLFSVFFYILSDKITLFYI